LLIGFDPPFTSEKFENEILLVPKKLRLQKLRRIKCLYTHSSSKTYYNHIIIEKEKLKLIAR